MKSWICWILCKIYWHIYRAIWSNPIGKCDYKFACARLALASLSGDVFQFLDVLNSQDFEEQYHFDWLRHYPRFTYCIIKEGIAGMSGSLAQLGHIAIPHLSNILSVTSDMDSSTDESSDIESGIDVAKPLINKLFKLLL